MSETSVTISSVEQTMKNQTPVNVKATSGFCVTGGAPDSGYCYDFLPRDKPAVSWLQGRRRKINTQKAWSSVFLTIAVLGMLVSCIRAVHVRISILGAGRILASGEKNEIDHERAAILELCLDLQEETGVIAQQPRPLPSPKEAIPVIREFLESSQVAEPQQIASFPFASSKSSAPAPTSRPDLTRMVAAGWGTGVMQAWDDPAQTAECKVPLHVEDEGVAEPSTMPLQRFHETPLQDMPTTPFQPPILQISAAASPHLLRSAVSVSSRKRGIAELGGGCPTNPAKQTKMEGTSQQFLPVPLPPLQQHLQEVAAKITGKDPIFQAMQALRDIWSLEPWEPLETAGDASPSGLERKETYTSLVQTMPHSLQQPEMHLVSSEQPPIAKLGSPTFPASPSGPEKEKTYTIPVQTTPHSLQQPGMHSFLAEQPPLAESGSPTLRASVKFPLPSTSLGLGRPLVAPSKSPLPGSSKPALTETSSPAPLPFGDDTILEQILNADSPANLDQTRLASHRFYRLPTLLPGPISKKFSPKMAFAPANSRTRPIISLGVIRSFLVQPAITPQDAATLIVYSEILVGRLYYELQLPLDDAKMSKVVEHLGRAFFALDALLSVIEVVGLPMDAQSWWPKLVSVIPQLAISPLKQRVSAAKVYNTRLAEHLVAALQKLKGGQRLAAHETIQLKRNLLSRNFSVSDFRDKKWDPWRDDDENSKGSVEKPESSGL